MRKVRSTLGRFLIIIILFNMILSNYHPYEEAFADQTESEEKAEENYALHNPYWENERESKWDCIYFGKYWQNDTNGDGTANRQDEKEPIKWRVLSVEGDRAVLVSDKNLDCIEYYTKNATIWDVSISRSWLNGYSNKENSAGIDYSNDNFINAAFSSSEQKFIENSKVFNDDCSIHTDDKIYLLSLSEVYREEFGFCSDKEDYQTYTRNAMNTEYTCAQGAYSYDSAAGRFGRSLLRNYDSTSADCLDAFGYLQNYHKENVTAGIRPVLCLNLSDTTVWSYAGTVSSEELNPWATEKYKFEDLYPLGTSIKNPSCDENGIYTWDCIWFGNYLQNDTNDDGWVNNRDAKEPIKWRVLSVYGTDAFLIADKNIERSYYHSKAEPGVTWKYSTIRSWLNGYDQYHNSVGNNYMNNNFITTAFSFKERMAIQNTIVKNEDNTIYGTSGGEDTLDKIYFLSESELFNDAYGLCEEDSPTSLTESTAYAMRGHLRGTLLDAGWWWLRTPGEDSTVTSMAMVVLQSGYVYYKGLMVNGNIVGASINPPFFTDSVPLYSYIRPVMHVDLSDTTLWSFAGTVSSNRTVREILPGHYLMPSPTPTSEITPLPSSSVSPSPSAEPTKIPSPTPVPTGDTRTPTPTVPDLPTEIPTPSALPDITDTPPDIVTVIPDITDTPPDIVIATPGATNTSPDISPTTVATNPPTGTMSPSFGVSPLPTEMTPPRAGTGLEISLSAIRGLALSQDVMGKKIRVRWKKIPVKYSTYVEIYRSTKKNAGYKRIARVSVKKNSYTDKKVKRNVTYYYKLRYTGSVNGKYISSGYTKQKKFTVYGLKTPKIKIKKKRTGTGINYLEIRLQRANGTYLELYVKRKGKYRKVKLASERRAYYRGIIRVQYAVKGKMYLRIRTGKKVRKKKRWSPWSNVVGVK